ncbi:MAG: hypothetical protein IJ705_01205, partial [Oscillospiraceae bacterium]|nr:hypothetical protein [Oscillospiraceae bacterium]
MKLLSKDGRSVARTEQPKRAAQPARAVRRRPSPKVRATLIALLAVAAVLLAGAAAGMLYVDHLQTIFPNVRVDGIDIGGKTLAETAEILTAHGYGDVGDQAVTVTLPAGCSLTLKSSEVCSETPVSDIALMAWDACKGGSSLA